MNKEAIAWLTAASEFFTIGNIADLLQVIGFVLTLSIWWSVRKIRRDYVFRVRVPMLVEQLESQAGVLYECLASPNHAEAIQKADLGLAKTDAILEDLIGHLGRRHGKSARVLLESIRNFKRKQYGTVPTGKPSMESIRPIYNDLHKVIQQVQNRLSSLEWERK